MRVVSFYRFTSVSDPTTLRDKLQLFCEQHKLLGTVLVAEEGVNGTLAGGEVALQAIFRRLETELALSDPLEGRWTDADVAPFQRMRVRQEGNRRTRQAGYPAGPTRWHARWPGGME